MTYDSLTEDGRLWAVKYDDCPDNALYMLFEHVERCNVALPVLQEEYGRLDVIL